MTHRSPRATVEALELARRRARRQELEAQDYELGCAPWVFVQAGLPHSDPGDLRVFERHNGHLRVAVVSASRRGYPYGRLARLWLAAIVTAAVKRGELLVPLAESASEFAEGLGLTPSGGPNGSMTRLADQFFRLSGTTMSVEAGDESWGVNIPLFPRWRVWWKGLDGAERSHELGGFAVELSPELLHARRRPVPIDLRKLRQLRSPLAMDLYCWLTYRRRSLQKPTTVGWEALHAQFGANYGQLRQFKAALLQQARAVLQLWPELRLHESAAGLVVLPGPPDIPRLT